MKLNKTIVEDIIPLTAMQEGMLFHYLKDPRGEYYFEQLSLEISGDIELEFFEKAWNFVIETNEMLRTVFRWDKVQNPVQINLQPYRFKVNYCVKKGSDPGDVEAWLEKIRINDRKNKFRLQDVPFRVTLCKVDETRYEMIISNHHILYDGWSNGIILKEFFDAYHTLRQGKSLSSGNESVKPVKTGYKEFVKWIKTQATAGAKKFWQSYPGGIETQTELPIKNRFQGKRTGTTDAGNCQINLAGDVKARIENFIKDRGITLASLLYTAWGVLLQNYKNTDDVVFGTTVSGRSAKIQGIESMVGLFINTIPLRIRTGPGETTDHLLRRIEKTLRQRQAYEHTSLVDIKKYSGNDKKEEFFDSIFILENYPLDRRLILKGSSLSVTSYVIKEMTHYDLTISVNVFEEIAVKAVYRKELFDDERVKRLLNHFSVVVDRMIENPGKLAVEIEIISDEEKRSLLNDFNDTDAEYPADKSIYELFAEQAERTPDNIAVVGPSQLHRLRGLKREGIIKNAPAPALISLTYRELDQQSHQLARRLRQKGVKIDVIVGLMMKRCPGMIIGILGILKAGGAYLPIEPDYPEERLEYILTDSGVLLVVTTESLAVKVKMVNCHLLIDGNHSNQGKESISSLPTVSGSSLGSGINHPHPQLAYIIYTSGTTGNPKAVMLEQQGVVNYIRWAAQTYVKNEISAFPLYTSISFDLTVTSIFTPLVTGNTIYIYTGEKGDFLIERILKENRVTVVKLTPAHLKLVKEIRNPDYFQEGSNIKRFILGGENLETRLAREIYDMWQGNIEIYNEYGPTETVVGSMIHRFHPGKDMKESVSIGVPIANTRIFLLDRYHKPVPQGVPGEIYIGGAGVARGYLNKPGITARKFLYLSFKTLQAKGADFTGKCYRTGDLARWLHDNTLEFLGRKDYQVKIRGYRVELGEIENRLLSHENILQAVVILTQDANKEKYLCAYVVSTEKFTVPELRGRLFKELPGYMIPDRFVRVEQIPLTPNGKVDRRALISSGITLGTGVEYVAPVTDVEKKLAETWLEVLGREAGTENTSPDEEQMSIGIHDNFFDVGGNSLSLIRLNSRLKEVFKKDIPMVALFNYPTIASLAGYLQQGDNRQQAAPAKEIQADKIKEKKSRGQGLEIAVIGISGRFPGARDIDEFRENLKNGVESISCLTDEQLQQLGVEEELIGNPRFVTAKGRLQEIEYFDAVFFGYTPAEAAIMDPQIRIFHECCWEALENAGYDPGSYDGDIGLYAGASPNPLWEIMPLKSGTGHGHLDAEQWQALQFSDKDYLSTRIAYKLNLTGPCVTLQTACSTSLAAVILACQALAGGACDMVLAGGVSVSIYDNAGYFYQEGAIMSPHGHCRAFDSKANGTVGGNGAGVVVLKPLAEAAVDNDTIYAVIKGFGINNDGKNKAGFTTPGVSGQVRVIQKALRMAGVDPGSIGYIETHGTGTILGDPIEIEALKQAFQSKDSHKINKKNYCAVGSVKTNIGHLDAAAGIAGFIKAVLSLKYRIIPPSLHFETPNPGIDFENSPFYVNRELITWKKNGNPLRAGVSSFGIGGTNVHIILEEAPGARGKQEHLTGEKSSRQYRLLLLSAKTPSALDIMTGNLAQHLKNNPGINLADAAFTLQGGRKGFNHRRMLLCNDTIEAVAVLASPDLASPGRVKTFHSKIDNPFIVFMFPGQGAQYVNMGRELYRDEPVFREEMDFCLEQFQSLMGYNIKEILYPADMEGKTTGSLPADINRTEITQPLLFIFEFALAKLLMHWGIKPQAMIGNSIGEYTAACLSGVFSLEVALKLVALRGKLMQAMPEGAMLGIALPEEEVNSLLNDELSLAAVNSTSRCVVSGPHEAVNLLAGKLREKGHNCRLLHTSHAFHSKMMDPILKVFEEKVGKEKCGKPMIPIISNISGQWLKTNEAADPGYWARQMRATVRFSDGIAQLAKNEKAIFLEAGPGRTLSTFTSQHKNKKSNQKVISLIRHPREEVSDTFYLVRQIGHLWLYGVSIDWQGFHSREKKHRSRIPLPTYPFERKCFPLPRHFFTWSGQPGGTTRQATSPPVARTGKDADIKEWFYVPQWKLSAGTEAPKHPGNLEPEGDKKVIPSSKYLVLVNEGSPASQLVKQLRQSGRDVTTAGIGTKFARPGPGSYTINPREESDYHDLFNELRALNKIPGKIIHLWNVTGDEPGANHPIGTGEKGFDPDRVNQALDLGFYSLLALARAIGALGNNTGSHDRDKIEIVVLTNNMQPVTGEEELEPLKSTIRGGVQVIPREYPGINCRSIDIDYPIPASDSENQDPVELMECLVKKIETEIETASAAPDLYVAYRNNRRWTQTYEQSQLEMSKPGELILKEKGVYLVTGGLGGIGLVLAEYLANAFKARLLLTGRFPFPDRESWEEWLLSHDAADETARKIRKIKELEALGAEVSICCADVTSIEQMQQVVHQAGRQFGKINGIIHAAGLPDGGLILNRKKEMSEKVLAPKVNGVLILDHLFGKGANGNELDFIMLCSSVSSVLAPVGQVAYCAANAFLDAFAFYNTARKNTLTISINWDSWQQVGMAVKAVEQLPIPHETLNHGISPSQGVEVFKGILANKEMPQVVVSTFDLYERIRESHTASPVSFASQLPGDNVAVPRHPRPELGTPYTAPETETEHRLAKIWQQFLGFHPVGIHDDFFELGGDSLKVMTLSAKIHQSLDVEIPLTEFFNRPTINKLALYIRESTAKSNRCSIVPTEKREYYAASSAQKRLFFLYRLDKRSVVYNETSVFLVEGDLDREKFQEVFNRLISRHECFRTYMELVDGEPVQRIRPGVEFDIQYYEAPGEKHAPTMTHHSSLIIHHFIRPFDLSQAPLLRLGLARLEKEKYLLMVDMHHIISDGLSQNVLIRDFSALYPGHELPGLSIQYRDFSQWQENEKRKGILKKQEEYWLKQLEGKIPLLEMPTDFTRPGDHCFEGSSIILNVGKQLTGELRKLVLEENSTMHIVLLTVFYILLFKYTEQEDIIIGSLIAGRTSADLDNIIGMFVNMLAMRGYPGENKSFREFLPEIKNMALEAYENQEYPFEELVEKLDLLREPGRHPLIDAVFVSRNIEMSGIELPGLRLTPYEFERPNAHFDLLLTAFEDNETLSLKLEYSTALFSPLTARRILEQYIEIINQAAVNQDIKLKEILITHDLLSASSTILQDNKDFSF